MGSSRTNKSIVLLPESFPTFLVASTAQQTRFREFTARAQLPFSLLGFPWCSDHGSLAASIFIPLTGSWRPSISDVNALEPDARRNQLCRPLIMLQSCEGNRHYRPQLALLQAASRL